MKLKLKVELIEKRETFIFLDIDNITVSANTSSPSLGEYVSISCDVSSISTATPSYKWMKDRVVMSALYSTQTIAVLISSVQDGGFYECEVATSTTSSINGTEIVVTCELKS